MDRSLSILCTSTLHCTYNESMKSHCHYLVALYLCVLNIQGYNLRLKAYSCTCIINTDKLPVIDFITVYWSVNKMHIISDIW